jgi:hypothetical protein
MRIRIFGGFRVFAVVLVPLLAVTAAASAPAVRQSAVTYLSEPTLIGSTFVVGPVVFEHDNARMARGEPCTAVYLYDPAKGRRTEEIASFHCIPRSGPLVTKLTIGTRPSTIGYGCVLTSYQFPDDPEVHGVPQPVDAH